MRRVLAYVCALVVAGALAVTFARPALAADGMVVVFSTEVTPLTVFENPSGCESLPFGAHTVVNMTDEVVRFYLDPFCATPGLAVQPDFGTHVTPFVGSFAVED